jgi:hypothetical protein
MVPFMGQMAVQFVWVAWKDFAIRTWVRALKTARRAAEEAFGSTS